MAENFNWVTFDINHLLPKDWTEQLHAIAKKFRDDRLLLPKHFTCREHSENGVSVATVDGITLRKAAPWLYELYKTEFVKMATIMAGRKVYAAEDVLHGVVLNIQSGTGMRYEAHVDTNPVEGLLYVTTNPPGTGGELVVATSEDCNSVEEIEASCSRIYPVSGHLIFIDGRKLPHYVTPLKDENAIRIVAAMNFYTDDCPEEMRPDDLSKHLKGYDKLSKESLA